MFNKFIFKYKKHRNNDTLNQLINTIFCDFNYAVTRIVQVVSIVLIVFVLIQSSLVVITLVNKNYQSHTYDFIVSCQIFALLFIATIYQMIVLDYYCTNALTVGASLGIPGQQSDFAVPFDLNIKRQLQPASMIKFAQLVLVLLLCVINIVLIEDVGCPQLMISRSASLQNVRAVSAFQSLNNRPNQFAQYSQYLEYQARLYELYQDQNRGHLSHQISRSQFEGVVNASRLIEFNDKLWDEHNPIRQSLDFAAQKAQAAIYQLVQLNFAQFMQIQPPRSVKIDGNLLPNPDGEFEYAIPVQSALKMHHVVTGMFLRGSPQGANLASQNISPLNNKYQSNSQLSETERLTVANVYLKSELLQLLNKQYNQFAENGVQRYIDENITKTITIQLTLIITFIIFSFVVILLIQVLSNVALVSILKNNLFSGLLLKKLIQLVKNE